MRRKRWVEVKVDFQRAPLCSLCDQPLLQGQPRRHNRRNGVKHVDHEDCYRLRFRVAPPIGMDAPESENISHGKPGGRNRGIRGEVSKKKGDGIRGLLLLKYGARCLACGATDQPLTVDHIKPLARGGFTTAWNLQLLCERCNCLKGDREIDYRPDCTPPDSPVDVPDGLPAPWYQRGENLSRDA